jgi:hypothetical protein
MSTLDLLTDILTLQVLPKSFFPVPIAIKPILEHINLRNFQNFLRTILRLQIVLMIADVGYYTNITSTDKMVYFCPYCRIIDIRAPKKNFRNL